PAPVSCALSLHDALPIFLQPGDVLDRGRRVHRVAHDNRLPPRTVINDNLPRSWRKCIAPAPGRGGQPARASDLRISWTTVFSASDRKSTRLNSSHVKISY